MMKAGRLLWRGEGGATKTVAESELKIEEELKHLGCMNFRVYARSFFFLPSLLFPSPFLLLVVRVSKANRISLQNLLSGWKHNCGTLRLTAASLYSINPKPRLFSLADCSNEPYVEPKGCEIEVNLKLNKERK